LQHGPELGRDLLGPRSGDRVLVEPRDRVRGPDAGGQQTASTVAMALAASRDRQAATRHGVGWAASSSAACSLRHLDIHGRPSTSADSTISSSCPAA
jgi:hypothetical protein